MPEYVLCLIRQLRYTEIWQIALFSLKAVPTSKPEDAASECIARNIFGYMEVKFNAAITEQAINAVLLLLSL